MAGSSSDWRGIAVTSHGLYYLKDYLRANGVPSAFENWVHTGFVVGMSRDGRVLVGYGAGPRDFTGYVVILPPLGEVQ